jgi:trigger factor
MPILEFHDESATKKTLSVEVPAEKVGEITGSVVRAWQKHASLPGFRKGHVPEKMVRKQFAEEIEKEVLERLIPEEIFGSLKERGLDPVVAPRVSDVHLHEGEPLRFKATVEIRPTIELGVYRGIPAPTFPTEPTEQEVDAALAGLAEPHAQYLPVENRRAMRGDFVVADVSGSFPNGDGTPFENPKVFLELGNPKNFSGINDLVPGSERGAIVEFDHTFEKDTPNSEMAGKTVHYRITVLEIKEKQLPPIDDDFAKNSGMAEDAASLRTKVTEAVRRQKEDAGRRAAGRAILDTLRESHPFEVPEGLVEEEMDEIVKHFASDLARGGVDLKTAEIDWKKIREESRQMAGPKVAERLILDAIAAKEGIDADPAEIDLEVRRAAREQGKDPKAVREEFEHHGIIDRIREEIRRAKVMNELVASAHTAEAGPDRA